MAHNSVIVGTSPTQIVAANNARGLIVLVNTSNQILYIGHDSSIKPDTAFPLLSQKPFETNWCGVIYGIVPAGTADVRYLEQEKG